MDLLRRQQAPIGEPSWQAIDEQAREVLTANMSARKVVDVSGPHGLELAAINLGRLDPGRVDAGAGVFYGIRKVLPLCEVRVPFSLDLWELDNVVRGAKDPVLDPLIEAAGKLARFEERAIYHGFPEGGIVGLSRASLHDLQQLAPQESSWPESIVRAMVLLKRAGEPPPYHLIAGPGVFQGLENLAGQYPLRTQIEALIAGPITLAPFIDGAFLFPQNNAGDFELTLGQDAAVGFEEQHGQEVRLYLTESFAFRVLEPQAVVAFTLAG